MKICIAGKIIDKFETAIVTDVSRKSVYNGSTLSWNSVGEIRALCDWVELLV